MADNETKPSADDGRGELVAKQLASTKIHLALLQGTGGRLRRHQELPLERVPQLDAALASLPSTFRTTVTRTVSVPMLLQSQPTSLAIRLTHRYFNRSRTAAASWGPTAIRPRVSGRRASA